MATRVLFLQLALDPTLINTIMFGLLLIVFYFFLIRPQARRQKQQAAFEEQVRKGQQVVTTSGILGRVSKVDKEAGTVTIEASKGTYLELLASSISRELTEARHGDKASG